MYGIRRVKSYRNEEHVIGIANFQGFGFFSRVSRRTTSIIHTRINSVQVIITTFVFFLEYPERFCQMLNNNIGTIRLLFQQMASYQPLTAPSPAYLAIVKLLAIPSVIFKILPKQSPISHLLFFLTTMP